jgi:hypothetical protein
MLMMIATGKNVLDEENFVLVDGEYGHRPG